MLRDPRVRIDNDRGGQLFAWSPDLPGCYAQGDSLHETVDNISAAIELYLVGADREALLAGAESPDAEPQAPPAAWTVAETEAALREAGFARTHVLGAHQLCTNGSLRLVIPFGAERLHPKIAGLVRQAISSVADGRLGPDRRTQDP